MHLRRFLLGLVTLWMFAFAPQAMAAGADFYWKASYGRGVGTIPDMVCKDGKNQIGALCYDPCPPGFKVSGLLCAKPCPDGYDDRGPTCHWKESISYVPEAHWDNCATKTKKRCTNWGGGNKTCVGGDCIGGLKAKCRDDYKNVAGVCWFNGGVPEGFTGTNLDPIKPGFPLPNPTALSEVCKGDKVLQGGLCYEACRKGYYGVGPVCWGNTPPNYVDCGAGFAKNSATCGAIVASQVISGVTAANMAIPPALKARALAMIASRSSGEVNAAKEVGADLAEEITKHGSEIIDLGKNTTTSAAKGGLAQLGDKMVSTVDMLFNTTKGKKIFAAFRAAGYAKGITTEMLPGDYFKVGSKDEIFARARDAMSFIALALAIHTAPIPPLDYPTPPEVATAVLDVMSAYMYTVYGE